MHDVPIKKLTVSDFRRIEGTRELPFDAPVVLIHGPNGTGKTSILSALELALTGGIRSMERQSEDYRAHLPFLGQPCARVQVEVAEHLQREKPSTPLTVNAQRFDGTPALNAAYARFYAERCYLDQASLGRLLDLYQAREGKEQTALEKFVNELLGLESLDALRDGLSDANDFRLFKRLATGVDEADREAKMAALQIKEQAAVLADARTKVADARVATRAAISGMDLQAPEGSDMELLGFVNEVLDGHGERVESASASAVAVHQELIALSGRISALIARPRPAATETHAALVAATADKAAWDIVDGVKVRAWEQRAHEAGVNPSDEPGIAVAKAADRVLRELEDSSAIRAQAEAVGTRLGVERDALNVLQRQLADAHELSSALVEGLSAIRGAVDDSNKCPVCDTDFAGSRSQSLLEHIDKKLSDLSNHGQHLVDLRRDRDQLAALVSRLANEHTQLTSRIPTIEQQYKMQQRYTALLELIDHVTEFETAAAHGAKLAQRVRELQQTLDDLESANAEESHIASELIRHAALLGVNSAPTFDSFRKVSDALIEIAATEVARLAAQSKLRGKISGEADRLAAAVEHESNVAHRLAEIAKRRMHWDDRVAAAKRYQGVAKEVYEAATQARANIVHRVFTESLNEVWKTVFTRLAPNEGFIPSFGIPTATKKTFDIKLETTHRNGEASGPPQMMLSAGNLNTAALSLFLALHLAVEPVVPCLVFDDPVQAMDEVHVAQFAGLVRLLSKQHKRQVVIAVHERELFDYLALELSPAYEGDELITIELGERAVEEDGGITRHRWAPDLAIAN